MRLSTSFTVRAHSVTLFSSYPSPAQKCMQCTIRHCSIFLQWLWCLSTITPADKEACLEAGAQAWASGFQNTKPEPQAWQSLKEGLWNLSGPGWIQALGRALHINRYSKRSIVMKSAVIGFRHHRWCIYHKKTWNEGVALYLHTRRSMDTNTCKTLGRRVTPRLELSSAGVKKKNLLSCMNFVRNWFIKT